ncbi:IPTL-CTERM sorting domain-containing protein [Ottowia testudinis]|uniref:IPTL-CTERM sorting domain-containing protein n=1 Tax=Ottowia testudinis TaxID=2816950 RepID=A0A975CJS7_9BURK|nr:IPTL-CTERM sorting domain-containing protein [Ottowia testudinis]QTD46376.1 IPTL-CTERM sorting domain-containing protein [Ottowia testudinis]
MRERQGRGSAWLCHSWVVLWWLVVAMAGLLFAPVLRAQEADCAEVKIVIEQKLSLERQAFDAHMVIRNGLDGQLTNVKVELFYKDQNQQPVVATTDPNAVGATFFQRIDRMTGISSLDGGTLAGKTDADIHWLILPSQGAGGDTANGRMYYIGAKVTYTLAGETTTVDVTPDYVVVRPQPLLVLDYFLPTDVYADDAMTPEVEPIVPFTLGVRVSNVGAGVSAKTTIESAQPKIVENRQGLLIDFRILGGYVGNEMLGKSLLLDFGDIPGQRAKVGRWVMETSLAGRFTEFNASFTHADSLGGAVTSLIKAVRTHKLVHDVLVDLAGHDNVYDFLAEFGNGYWVYDSNGGDAEVVDASKQASLTNVSNGNLRLTFPSSSNLIHAKLPDPFSGNKPIARVVRSDGKVLPPQNYWLSKTRNADLSWSYFLHVFDSNATGDYILEFGQSTQGSIAGSAYRDSNGNGIRDAGEPAEGNLGIVLKGVDANGQSILRQGYTDPSGAFSFTGLAPGRYQLEAAVANGWVDGIWMAGSAGGTAQPGLIKDIVLNAGAAGVGYLIAKRKPDAEQTTDKADVSIVLQAAKSQLRGGEATSVTVTVRNAGEASAQAVTSQVAVPAGLTLQGSSASLGSYAGGAWTIGVMTKGQVATLTLDVKADAVSGTKDKTISWPASVSARTTDPQTGNNSALLGLTVLADKTNTVEMSQTLPAQARVLMLVSCPQTSAADQAACETQVAQVAQDTVAANVHALQTATTLAGWNVAQRSGAYNLLWLHGGADKLDDPALAEIRAAVRRGATLVVDGLPGVTGAGPKVNQLADVTSARISLPAIGDNQSVKFPNEPMAQVAGGTLYGLQLQSPPAQRLADSASSGAAVITSSTWGHGQSWVMGFDLLASLQGPAASFWGGYVSQQIKAFTPISRSDPALAGARLPLRTTVRSNAETGSAPQDVSVRVQLPSGLGHGEVAPTPLRDESQLVEWAWRLAPAQGASGDMRLTLPQTSRTLQVQTTLLDSAASSLDVKTQSIMVVGLDSLTPQVGNALTALISGNADTLALIAQARQAADAAKAAQQQSDWDSVLKQLATLQAQLDALAGTLHNLAIEPLRLDVARWIGVAQQNWTPSNAPQPAKLVAVAGSGQTTVVSTAFANALQARVEDANGQPVAGVAVRFNAPTSGASGSFGGAQASAQALTDAQGIATSPALTANGTVGSYAVTAQVDGLAPASFTLTNRSGGVVDTPAALRMVSGTAQTAQIGTAFGAPMVVQVLSAAGQPLAGVSVRFAFASQGASASFAGNRAVATVMTDASGQAASPAFTANQTAGTHQANASVTGMSGGIFFTLINSQQAPTLTLQSIDGLTQSAPVNTAYGQRIIVRVVDAQGKPKAGVAVQFSLPASGPSASFGGNQVTASATTGADGTALSPAFVANGQQGSFRAVITAEGAAQPLQATLTNLAAAGSGKQFQGTTATGTGTVTATVSGGGDTCVFNPSATRMVPPEGIWTPLQKFLLPHGLFDFELVGCEPGSEVTISTTWPDLKGITGYMKHGRNPLSLGRSDWYLPLGLKITGNTVTFTIRDGGWGDDDLAVNGVIRDPGGPVVDQQVNAIPTLGQWALMLLAGLIGLTAWRRRALFAPRR